MGQPSCPMSPLPHACTLPQAMASHPRPLKPRSEACDTKSLHCLHLGNFGLPATGLLHPTHLPTSRPPPRHSAEATATGSHESLHASKPGRHKRHTRTTRIQGTASLRASQSAAEVLGGSDSRTLSNSTTPHSPSSHHVYKHVFELACLQASGFCAISASFTSVEDSCIEIRPPSPDLISPHLGQPARCR